MLPDFRSFSDELVKISESFADFEAFDKAMLSGKPLKIGGPPDPKRDVRLFEKMTGTQKFPRPKTVKIPGGVSTKGLVLAGLSAGALTAGGALLMAGKKGRKRVAKEHRDPRLYSNLRGMAALEGGKKRVAAHKRLSKTRKDGKPHTILSAAKSGLTRS